MVRMQSTLKTFVAFALMSVFLTACWDKIEINELAIASMAGVDIDPETGKKTVYYQIINPLSGATAGGTPSADMSPVYTYEISGQSFGEIKSMANKLLSRKLFVAHYKAVVISQRAAEYGIRDIVNLIEVQPNVRSSIPMLVADGPVSQIMRTYSLLERLPADAVESRLHFLNTDSLIVGKHIRVKDVSERMQKSEMIVLPMIKEKPGNVSQHSGERASDINANKSNFLIGGGAVFRGYRMAGRLNDTDLIWYHLLTGNKGQQPKLFQVDGKRITVVMKQVRFDRSATWRRNKPVVTINMELRLSTGLATEYLPQSWDEAKRLERKLAQSVTHELYAFYKKTKKKGWDLLGIKKTVERTLPQNDPGSGGLNDVEVIINVDAKFQRIGSINKRF